MAGFATLADLQAELGETSGKYYREPWTKSSANAGAGSIWHSLWPTAGDPGAGAAPAATPGTAYTNAVGSINFPDTSPDLKYLASFGHTQDGNSVNGWMLYDRLVAVSGIALNATGAKTVNSAALPRYTLTAAAGVEVWLEITTAGTTTAFVVALNQYTNEAGTAARAGPNFTCPTATPAIGNMFGPLPLQVGDKGVRSVQIGVNVVTAATAAICNVVLLRRLAYGGTRSSVYNETAHFVQVNAMTRVYDGASLCLAFIQSGSNNSSSRGVVDVVYG